MRDTGDVCVTRRVYQCVTVSPGLLFITPLLQFHLGDGQILVTAKLTLFS